MERMKDLTQQYVEQLENMVKDLREKKLDLEEENKKLNEKVRFLEECLDRKEKLNKKLREELSAYDREYFDEDKKAKNIFMEEDTLQELRDIGEI
jgi:vacuolar-type H+-ATPase subunit I/STV1